jgi:hypothetical protein
MKYRLMQKKTTAVIPSANEAAKRWLTEEGFLLVQSLPRMVLGKDVPWQPEKIFNRATGYCG